MNIGGKRLEKVLSVLSGREHALLFLREYKEGVTHEITTPGFLSAKEHNEYARLLNMVRAANNELGDLVLIVREQVTQEELRFSALRQMVMAADDLWLLGKYVKEFVPEPVTASQAKSRKKEPKSGFHVYADGEAEDVAVMQEDRQAVEKMTGRHGYRLKLPLDMSGEISADPKRGPEVARLIAAIVRDNLATYWQQLRAVDVVVGGFAEELGDDPLRPKIREFLDDALARCATLRDELVEYIGEWQLPDDVGDALALTRKLVERVLR